MCHRFIRYGVSHCLHAAMTRLEEAVGGSSSAPGVHGEVSPRPAILALGYLSGLFLLIAVCLGLYARWEVSQDEGHVFLVTLVLALALLGLAVVLYCYCHMERASLGLVHLWLGFLLGLLSFVDGPALDRDVKERATDYLLLASMALRTMWALLERVCGCTRYRPAFLTSAEQLELAGFAGASLVVLGDGGRAQLSVAVVVALVGALAVVMVALRMKAVLALPNLVCFVAVTTTLLFLRSPDGSTAATLNPFALACFFSQLVCDPLLDVYFSGLSVTERWQPFLAGRGVRRLSLLLLLLLVEAGYLVLAGRELLGGSGEGRRWYVTVPAFAAFGLFWAISHLVFFITVWGFHGKIGECQRVCSAQGSGVTSLDKVMASRGVRHFCIISQQLILCTLVSTVALAALTLESLSSLFVSTFLLVLPLESLFHGLFHELGSCLGGTCVGYAVVVPTNYCSPDGQPMLLPPDQVQRLNRRSTDMLSGVQRLFAHHLVESHGCDYSTSGVGLDALQAKLRAFLELRTADGPRHDTYVVFYSGHTHRSGEWALAGGDSLRLDQILEWWREKNAGACSRLILVLDVDSALPWANEVSARSDPGLYVAVQGATLRPSDPKDPELQDGGQLGDFTARWVAFNCEPGADVRSWSDPGRTISAVYGVSRRWGDYALHLPTGGDITKHWRTHFPRVTYPVVQLALWVGGLGLLGWGGCCGGCLRCLRRFKLNWFPPAVLDTGLGFKLVRS